MALNSLIRRASATVVPLAIRAVGSRRAIHGAISTVEKCTLVRQLNSRSFAPVVRFSTAAAEQRSSDEKLVDVIESEIECAEKDVEEQGDVNAPDGFPFKIEDNPGERTIFLERKIGDEIIKVEVDMPALPDEDEDEDEDEDDGEDDGFKDSTFPMVVSISKRGGASLEFGITASMNQMSIDSLTIKQPGVSEDQLAYEGPDFNDLDENLQKSFYTYLENRGINQSTTQYLLDYMTNKDGREYLRWLKDLKDFINK